MKFCKTRPPSRQENYPGPRPCTSAQTDRAFWEAGRALERVTRGPETKLLWILLQSPYLSQEIDDHDKATIYDSETMAACWISNK